MSFKDDLDQLAEKVIDVQVPSVKFKMFRTLDAALDFCKFAEPESMMIDRIYEGGMGFSEVVGYQVQYTGSKGDR